MKVLSPGLEPSSKDLSECFVFLHFKQAIEFICFYNATLATKNYNLSKMSKYFLLKLGFTTEQKTKLLGRFRFYIKYSSSKPLYCFAVNTIKCVRVLLVS